VFTNEDYLAELLIEGGIIEAEQLKNARASLSGSQTIIQHLIKRAEVTETQVAETLAANAGIPFVDLAGFHFDPTVILSVSEDTARRYRVIPVSDDGLYLTVAVADPLDFETLDSLPHVIGRELNLACATQSDINHHLMQFYKVNDKRVDKKEEGFLVATGDSEAGVEANDAPIIRLVQQALTEAFRLKASDIHIEPLETSVRIRYRLDGKLVHVDTHPKKLLPAIVARLKVMSGSMSIAEKRLPQDGRIQLKMSDKEVDLRVSSVPSNHGESIVMRILDKTALLLGLPELGFFSDDQAEFETLLKLPDGIILVTGPTGSGKTTTLYACLNVINKPDKKIITVEDPVEYELPGINQVMVKSEIGMTFAAALRAMLRQAPNIIMIGEIRDFETAEISINAALTGHMVFSTLHTNDSVSAVTRLVDIGVKPFLVSAALRGALAQRLVRRVCQSCAQPYKPTAKELYTIGMTEQDIAGATPMKGAGCAKCGERGYKGRRGVFELFVITEEIQEMVYAGANLVDLRRKAREAGMRTMREDGQRKVASGMTTIEEVLGATVADDVI